MGFGIVSVISMDDLNQSSHVLDVHVFGIFVFFIPNLDGLIDVTHL